MERDKKFFDQSIQKHPYPTYNEVMSIIENDDDFLICALNMVSQTISG